MDMKINVNITTCSPCLLHGPCGTVSHDGDTACVRCIKREKRPRAAKRDQPTKKDEGPLRVDLHRLILKQVKDVERTYLQVVVVPADIKKTTATTRKERQKRLKYEDEIRSIEHWREFRIREMCVAYCLPIPTLYSPFVHNPFWFRRKKVDCSDHLHLVQAVLQSFEKREKIHNVDELKSRSFDEKDTLYRTSKIAAWRALRIRGDDCNSLTIDLLPEQQASKSYMAFLDKVNYLTGGMPTATGPMGYQPCSKFVTRVSGARRRNPKNTYMSDKYSLKSYRYRVEKRPSVAHQVKATAKMEHWLNVANKNKHGNILQRLRTAIILRKFYHRNSVEFEQSLKLFLLDHASEMIGPKTPYKWLKYFQAAIPPPKQPSQIGMASYILEHKYLRDILQAWVKQEREHERVRSAKVGQIEKPRKLSIHEKSHVGSPRCPRCKRLRGKAPKKINQKPGKKPENGLEKKLEKKSEKKLRKEDKKESEEPSGEPEADSQEEPELKEEEDSKSAVSSSSSDLLSSSEEEEDEAEDENSPTEGESSSVESETDPTEEVDKLADQSLVHSPDSDVPEIVVETSEVKDETQMETESLQTSPTRLEPTPSPDPGSDDDGRKSRGCSKSCCSLL